MILHRRVTAPTQAAPRVSDSQYAEIPIEIWVFPAMDCRTRRSLTCARALGDSAGTPMLPLLAGKGLIARDPNHQFEQTCQERRTASQPFARISLVVQLDTEQDDASPVASPHDRREGVARAVRWLRFERGNRSSWRSGRGRSRPCAPRWVQACAASKAWLGQMDISTRQFGPAMLGPTVLRGGDHESLFPSGRDDVQVFF